MVGLVEVHCRGDSFVVRIEFMIIVMVDVSVQRQKRLIFFIYNFDLCHTNW